MNKKISHRASVAGFPILVAVLAAVPGVFPAAAKFAIKFGRT
jgi:hypothetical protein